MQVQSQITMAWNGSELLVEAANPKSGAREKIAISFSDLPLEMQLVLRTNLDLARNHKEQVEAYNRANSKTAIMAREQFLRDENAKAARERDQRWNQYLSNLAPHVVAYHEHKKALRIAK